VVFLAIFFFTGFFSSAENVVETAWADLSAPQAFEGVTAGSDSSSAATPITRIRMTITPVI
jgi:hypothetical protein